MTTRDLLIEIGTEELPPKALPHLSRAFCEEMAAGLAQHSLAYADIIPYATPRRLAMRITGLALKQDDIAVEKFGPAVKAAFDADGKPTRAAEGFARSCGINVDQLGQKDDGKLVKLYYSANQPGAETSSLIPDLISTALAKLPVPKRMRWGSKRDEFVRPVHWVILLFGSELIAANIMGVSTSAETRGHRFHHPGNISLASPDVYEQALIERGFVLPSFAQRRDKIQVLLREQAELAGGTVIIDEDLLDEVTALVEWPVALTGRFDKAYLDVPQEALVSSMKEHQKCFHMLDDNGRILPLFITVSNLASRDPAQVIAGNERVISPRLADAAFFYSQDRKQPLESRSEKLKTVIFQQDLGTLFEKSSRVTVLAELLSEQLGTDTGMASRAATLGKCDLLTSMVYEFPELQGIMGSYYARADGEADDVACALNEQYLPRFSGDQLPDTKTGTVLALAERIDTIAGLFAIGQPPTGSKDPFALRRAALGVIRIIIENSLELDLPDIIDKAVSLQPVANRPDDTNDNIYRFFIERLRGWYAEQGISADTFQSVEALQARSLRQFDLRLKAVDRFRTLPEAEALSAANKRVANILAKLVQQPDGEPATSLFEAPAETALAQALAQSQQSVENDCDNEHYLAALQNLCTLRPIIDNFFNDVMVNADDPAIRVNRQKLLAKLRTLFLRIADISKLQISGS